MAIAKKPESNRSAIAAHREEDSAADAFISGAESEPQVKDTRKVPVLVRFDRSMLKRVDGAAKRRGVSRSAWIHFMVSRALDQEEG
jgi:hypothetical protein